MKRSFLVLLFLATFLTGACLGIKVTKDLLITHWDFVGPDHLFSATQPLPIPSLQAITAEASNDREAFKAVADYFTNNGDQLARVLQEQNPTRLKALFAMYTIHVSHLYGTIPYFPTTFLEYLRMPVSDCGTYAAFQSQLLTALGVQWRSIAISGGTHVFDEANIDGQWEYFDSTINVWTNKSAFEMERGADRTMRRFYTPLLDESYQHMIDPDALRVGQELRTMMPGLGLFFFPKAYLAMTSFGEQ